MEEDTIKVLRIIEYVGKRSWVEKTVANSINGTKIIPKCGRISAATIGDYPECLSSEEAKNESTEAWQTQWP